MPEITENFEDSKEPENKPLKSMRVISASKSNGVALPSILKRFQRTKQYGVTPVTRQRAIAKNNQEKFKDFGLKVKQKNSQNLGKLNLSAGKKKTSWEKVDMVLPTGESGSAPKDNSDLDSLRQLLNSMPASKTSQSKPAGKTSDSASIPPAPAPRTAPAAQPKQVSKPRWKGPDPGSRRYSSVEEVSPRRSEPGQISEPLPQSQAEKTATPPPATQDRQVIQRQVQRPPVPEEKPKPAVQKPEETERPQEQQKTTQSSKPSVEPESGKPEKVLKASEDLTLKRPAVRKPKEETRTVEVQREPLRETTAPKKPVQVIPPAEDNQPKIEKSGKMETGEKQARSTSPDKTPVPLPRPETPKTIKKPEVQDGKTSGDEIVRIQPLKKMNLLRQQKRRAEAAVQRMLEKSPDKSRPFTQPAAKTEMPLVQRQEIKSNEQDLRQEKPAKPVLTVSAGEPRRSSALLSKGLVQRPMRLNLWKQTEAKTESSRSYQAAEPLRRIEKPQKGVLKPSLRQKLTRRSLVQRTLAVRKPAVQPLTLRKPAGIHQDKGPGVSDTSDKKSGLLSPVARPVVRKAIFEPAASSQAASPEAKTEKLFSGKTTLQKSTLLQRTILHPERKMKPPIQKTSEQEVDLRPEAGKSLPPEMPLRKSAKTINQREITGRTEKTFSESVSRARVPVFRPGLRPKTTVQRLLAHQKRTTTRFSSNLLLQQKQPQRRMVSEEKDRDAVQREEPRRLEKAAPARSGSVVQRMLETALPKPLRLGLNQKAGRKTDSQYTHPTVSNHILAAGQGTGQLVQRIQSRNWSTAQHAKKETVQPQAKTAEFLRKKIEQAFPSEPELPVVNIARQSGSGNLVQREIENKQAAAGEPSPGMGADGPQPGEPQQDPASAPQFKQAEDVSWSMQADAGPEQAEKPDLQSLARQVFPIVKRLLALEKERSTGRSF